MMDIDSVKYGSAWPGVLAAFFVTFVLFLTWSLVAEAVESDTIVWEGECRTVTLALNERRLEATVRCDGDTEFTTRDASIVFAIMDSGSTSCQRVESQNGGIVSTKRSSWRCG